MDGRIKSLPPPAQTLLRRCASLPSIPPPLVTLESAGAVLALASCWCAPMSAPRSWHGRHSSACDEKADDRGESGGREVDGAVSGSCKQRGARVLRGAAAARGADPIRMVQRAAGQI